MSEFSSKNQASLPTWLLPSDRCGHTSSDVNDNQLAFLEEGRRDKTSGDSIPPKLEPLLGGDNSDPCSLSSDKSSLEQQGKPSAFIVEEWEKSWYERWDYFHLAYLSDDRY